MCAATRPDRDPDYCEPLVVPGDEVVDLETGELRIIRLVLPLSVGGAARAYLYVAADGWTDDGANFAIMHGNGSIDVRSPPDTSRRPA